MFGSDKSLRRDWMEQEQTSNFKNIQGFINLSGAIVFDMIMKDIQVVFHSMQID
jgi:uncharacterized protein YeeX (DUF496 family)